MTSKIARVANIAFQVFSQHSNKIATTNNNIGSQILPSDKLKQLLTLLHKVDGKDVGFDINWAKNNVGVDGSNVSAPVLYVHIMENEVFSLGIFVLRPGSRIPLHDHPNMFGIVKVIHGNVRCRSFSPVFGNKASFIPRICKWQHDDLIVAVPYHDSVIDSKSDPMMLTPSNGNYHELFTVGNEGAAFIDILAPPYDHCLGKRECRFYQEISLPRGFTDQNGINRSPRTGTGDSSEHAESAINDSSSITHQVNMNNHQQNHSQNSATNHIAANVPQQYIYLTETHQPKDYWCDLAEYRGPSITP